MRNYWPMFIGAALAVLAAAMYGILATPASDVAPAPGVPVLDTPLCAQGRIEIYKAKLMRENPDHLRIYDVGGSYEVWCSGIGQSKWRDASTLEEARKIADDYYTSWASNCVGDQPMGILVE